MQRFAYVVCGIGPHSSSCLPCGSFEDNEAEVLDPWPTLEAALEQVADGATALSLTDQFLGEEAGSELVHALQENSTVRILQLNGCGLGDEFAKELRLTLTKNISLEILDLDFNCIGDVGIGDLSTALRANQVLKELELNENEIGSYGAKHLAQALVDNVALSKLSLHGNRLGDEGAGLLGRALQSNEGLMRLVLVRNGIGDRGAVELARGVSHNLVLQVLSLGENNIADEGAKALAQMLKDHKCLQEFQLDDNLVSDEGAQALAIALESNSILVEMWLVDNAFSSSATRWFGAALMRNNALKRLGLSSTKSGLSSEDLQALRKAHRKRRWQAQSGAEDGPTVVTPTAGLWSGAGLIQAIPSIPRRVGAWHSAWVNELFLNRSWDPTPQASSLGSSRAASVAGSLVGSLRGRSPRPSPRGSPRGSASPCGSPRCSPDGSLRGSPRNSPSPRGSPRESPSPRGSPRSNGGSLCGSPRSQPSLWSSAAGTISEDHPLTSGASKRRERIPPINMDSNGLLKDLRSASSTTSPEGQSMTSPSVVRTNCPPSQACMPTIGCSARRHAPSSAYTIALKVTMVAVEGIGADYALCRLQVRGKAMSEFQTGIVKAQGGELRWDQGHTVKGVQEGDVMDLEIHGSSAGQCMLCKGVIPLTRECFLTGQPSWIDVDLSDADMKKIAATLKIKVESVPAGAPTPRGPTPRRSSLGDCLDDMLADPEDHDELPMWPHTIRTSSLPLRQPHASLPTPKLY